MSIVVWDGDNVLQKVGKNVEELGHVKFDPNSNTAVLWLRDTQNVFGVNGGYVRGDEFPTMTDAKENAADSMSARLLHQAWLAGLAKSGKAGRVAVRALAGIHKPLTESTFKEEMERRDRAERVWKILSFILGVLSLVFVFL